MSREARVLPVVAQELRRVGRNGTISLYDRDRSIGEALKGLDVYVSLAPVEVEWVYSDGRGPVTAVERRRD